MEEPIDIISPQLASRVFCVSTTRFRQLKLLGRIRRCWVQDNGVLHTAYFLNDLFGVWPDPPLEGFSLDESAFQPRLIHQHGLGDDTPGVYRYWSMPPSVYRVKPKLKRK